MAKDEYKPNSHKYNEIHNQQEKDSSASSNKAEHIKPHVREHKSIGQRFKDTFFAESFKSVVEYIIWDVVIPATKDMLLQFVETTLFGRSESSRRYDYGYYSRTGYQRSSVRSEKSRSSSIKTRPSRNFSIDRFEFESRREAEDVLAQMNEQCRKYDGVCPVSSFYDFIECDRPNDWTHERWGWSWNALDRARIIPKSNGWYVLNIPEPDTYID